MLEETPHAKENGKSGIERSLIVRFLLSDIIRTPLCSPLLRSHLDAIWKEELWQISEFTISLDNQVLVRKAMEMLLKVSS